MALKPGLVDAGVIVSTFVSSAICRLMNDALLSVSHILVIVVPCAQPNPCDTSSTSIVVVTTCSTVTKAEHMVKNDFI
jgi:hypothetical protein